MIRLFAILALLLTTSSYTLGQESMAPGIDETASTAKADDSSQPVGEGSIESPVSEGSADSQAFRLDNLDVQSATETQSVWLVLPAAFLAGFLLNFMPCVLPVVGLKLLSFVQQAQSDRRRILLMNLSYTAGLISVMLVLASLAVFAGLGWGEQFSSTAFTITLATFVFAFGLSFLGVWDIPLPGFVSTADGKAPQEGYAGAFSKGILSTLLATPCSGPFLGAALAWAVTQPAVLTYAVFVTVGLGMASPYLFIGAFPSMIRLLPKPGNWMVTFKYIMGFVMLGTVVYLMTFISIPAVVPTVLLLLGVGFAVWYAGQTPFTAPSGKKLRAWGIAAVVILLTSGVSFGWLQGVMQSRFERAAARLQKKQNQVATVKAVAQSSSNDPSSDTNPAEMVEGNQEPSEQTNVAEAKPSFNADQYPSTTSEAGIVWRDYSPELLESAIAAGQPVFVDFTADWCLTCKSNEAAAVETEAFSDALKEHQIIALRADKTEPNEPADTLLKKLGNKAASIPCYAFFNPKKPTDPIVMDGIITSHQPMVEALTNIIQ